MFNSKANTGKRVWECQLCNTTFDTSRTVCTECGNKKIQKLSEEKAKNTDIDVEVGEQEGDTPDHISTPEE